MWPVINKYQLTFFQKDQIFNAYSRALPITRETSVMCNVLVKENTSFL